MKTIAAIFTVLAIGATHYMAWAEDKCAELGNTPQQCALLSAESL